MSDPWASPGAGEPVRPVPSQPAYGQPPPPLLREAVELPPVRGRDVLLTLLAFAVGGLGALVLALVAVEVSGQGRYAFSAAMGAAAVGCWAALWLVLVRRLGWGWRELGFVRARRSGLHLLWQVPASIVASVVAAAAAGSALGLQPDERSAQADVAASLDAGVGTAVLVGLVAVLVVPAAEEVVFRRVLLDWLLPRVPVTAAVLVAAVVFALAHVAPVVMVYVVFLGVALGVLRVWYGSLWPPLVLHAANNALVAAVALAAVV